MATEAQEVFKNEVVKLSLVKFEEVAPETTSLVKQAEVFVINSDDKLLEAQTRVVEAQKRKKFIEGVFAPMKESAKETKDAATKTYKEVNDLIEKATAPCERVKEIYGQKGVVYTQEQERIRAEEARRRELAAKKEAEDRALAEAQHAEAMGDKETANAILNEGAVMDIPPPPVQAVPQAAGIRFTEYWSAKGIDLLTLVKEIAAGRQPIAYVMFNDMALNQTARAQKGAMRIPGVQVHCEKKMSPTGR